MAKRTKKGANVAKFPVENSATQKPKTVIEVEKPVEIEIDPKADQASRFIFKLPEDDLKALNIQKTFTENAVEEATEAQSKLFKSQVVANMMQAAYNAAWTVIQRKHGLPEVIDVDWTDGSIFRKSSE